MHVAAGAREVRRSSGAADRRRPAGWPRVVGVHPIWFVVLAIVLVGAAMLVAGLIELRRRLPALTAALDALRRRRGDLTLVTERAGTLNLEVTAARARLAAVRDESPLAGRHRS